MTISNINGSASSPEWPEPAASTIGAGMQFSGQAALLALLVQSQTTVQSGAKQEVELNWQQLQELKQQLAEAVRQAQEAQEHSGFWGFLGDIFGSDIAQVVEAVAAAAAVVATGGAAAPLVLVALSAAAEYGAKVAAELGLDPKLCMLMSLAGAAVGLFSGVGTGQAISSLVKTAQTVRTVAEVASGAATIAGASFNYVSAQYHATALHHQADATYTETRQDDANLAISQALSDLEQSLKNEARANKTVSNIVQDNANSQQAILAHVGGAA